MFSLHACSPRVVPLVSLPRVSIPVVFHSHAFHVFAPLSVLCCAWLAFVSHAHTRVSTGIFPHAGTDAGPDVTRVCRRRGGTQGRVTPSRVVPAPPPRRATRVLSWAEPRSRGPGDVAEHGCRGKRVGARARVCLDTAVRVCSECAVHGRWACLHT
ncbi:hypothetical protein ACRRTK_002862 [Alexandromys fortis]